MPTDVPIENIPISEFRGRSFGSPNVMVRVDTSAVGFGLEQFNIVTKKAIRSYFEQDAAPMLRDYMKQNHKWKNRTRNAEVGLTAEVITQGNLKRDDYSIRIALYHTTQHNGYHYGDRLEQDYEGRYAILEPTARLKGPEVVQGMQGIIDKYS